MPRTFVSSQLPRNARTLALQMAMEAAQREEVGARIRELRGPLPQPELARKLDVSLRAVQKWEAGESAPQWENLVRLSKLFGVTQDFLLYGDRNMGTRADADTQLDRIEAKLDQVLSLLRQYAFEQELADATQPAESPRQPERGNAAA